MKALKYAVLVFLLVLALVAGVVHYYRESLARTAANAALAGLGVRVTGLTVREIGTDTIRLSRLALEQDDGTRYEMSDLTFPLSVPGADAGRIEVGRLGVTPADRQTAPKPPAPLVRTLLRLPESVPNTKVTIRRLDAPGFPPVHDVAWRTEGPRQRLALRIPANGGTIDTSVDARAAKLSGGDSGVRTDANTGTRADAEPRTHTDVEPVTRIDADTAPRAGVEAYVDVTIDVDPAHDAAYRITVNATSENHPVALALRLDVRDGDGGVAMNGDLAFSTAPWVPALKSADLLPAGVAALDAGLAGPVTIELADDASRSSRAGARLSLADVLTARYRVTDGPELLLHGTSPTPLTAGLAYPSLEWTARIDRFDIRVGNDSVSDIPMQLRDLECRAGPRCAVHASADTGPVDVGTITIAAARLAVPLTVTLDDSGTENITRMNVAPDAGLVLSGIESSGWSAASVATTQLAGARLTIDDDEWRIDVDRLDLQVDAASDRAGLSASGPVRFSALRIRDSGAAVDTEAAIEPRAASVFRDDTGVVVPGVAGNLSLRDGRVSATLALAEDDALTARVDASHDLATGAGELAVHDAELRFDAGRLSHRLVQWPYAWDVVAGRWTADLELRWHVGADGIEYAGTATQRADALAGHYQDTVFAGLSTTLNARLDATAGITMAPASLEAALIDVGVPLEQVAMAFSVDVEQRAVRVDKLSLATLGGRIEAEPFRFGMQEARNGIVLRPQSIQLPFIMDLVEFEDIEITGSISGVIPITINDMKPTINNGELQSDPSGGVIRYRPGMGVADAGASAAGLDLVTRALANFQFDSLTSNVEYRENGDLRLQMKLSGINPDMDDTRPVILNLDVQDNVPTLLRSLRAARSIEEILARKAAE